MSFSLTIAKFLGSRVAGTLWKRFAAEPRLHAAVLASREEQIDEMLLVVSEQQRAVAGLPLGPEEALQKLIAFASDPVNGRRFRMLWAELERCADPERVVMLTAVFMADIEVSHRARIDWAVCQLFPQDVKQLAAMIAAACERDRSRGLVALESVDVEHGDADLVLSDSLDPEQARFNVRLSAPSLHALAGAQCITFGSPVVIAEGTHAMYPVGILPLGRDLSRLASSIDWEAIARHRGGDFVGKAG